MVERTQILGTLLVRLVNVTESNNVHYFRYLLQYKNIHCTFHCDLEYEPLAVIYALYVSYLL